MVATDGTASPPREPPVRAASPLTVALSVIMLVSFAIVAARADLVGNDSVQTGKRGGTSSASSAGTGAAADAATSRPSGDPEELRHLAARTDGEAPTSGVPDAASTTTSPSGQSPLTVRPTGASGSSTTANGPRPSSAGNTTAPAPAPLNLLGLASPPAAPTSTTRPAPGSTQPTTAPSPTPDPGPTGTTDPALDGRVTLSVQPSTTSATLHDRLWFDVVLHNGTSETIHTVANACVASACVEAGVDPALDPVTYELWDGSASSLLALLDRNTATNALEFAGDPAIVGAGPHPLGLWPMGGETDVASGTDLHVSLAWDVNVGIVPFSGTVYARGFVSYTTPSSAATLAAFTPIVGIGVADEQLRVDARDQAARTAMHDPRVPAMPSPGTQPGVAGGWYHDGRWVFELYPVAIVGAPGTWVTVDATTFDVVDVRSSG